MKELFNIFGNSFEGQLSPKWFCDFHRLVCVKSGKILEKSKKNVLCDFKGNLHAVLTKRSRSMMGFGASEVCRRLVNDV